MLSKAANKTSTRIIRSHSFSSPGGGEDSNRQVFSNAAMMRSRVSGMS